jgi:Protease inhibitor Inh
MTLRLGLIVVAVAAAGVAFAQTSSLGDSAKALIGAWEFSNADRDKICTATFKSDPTPVGFKVEFDKNCATLFPIVANVAGWIFNENDLLRLLDAQKKTLIEFSEVEDNIYEAPTPGLGVLFLQNAADAGPSSKPPEQVAGDWAVVRGSGAPLCRLTLTTNAVGDDGLALTVQPGCDAAIARLNFGQWRMDRGELMIYPARGNPWRFEAVDDSSWRRLPESDNGYMLVKQ